MRDEIELTIKENRLEVNKEGLSAREETLRKLRKLFAKCGIKVGRNKLIAHLKNSELVVNYKRDDRIEWCDLIKNQQSKLSLFLVDPSEIWGSNSDLLF